jgi:hypothetical protein
MEAFIARRLVLLGDLFNDLGGLSDDLGGFLKVFDELYGALEGFFPNPLQTVWRSSAVLYQVLRFYPSSWMMPLRKGGVTGGHPAEIMDLIF